MNSYDARVRKGLEKVIDEHNRLQNISNQDLELERLSKLQFLVNHHYENNPIYRQMLDQRGVKPNHIKNLKDIELLPIVTSKDIMTYGENFITNNSQIRTFLHTSGSTGISKLFPVDMGEESRRITEASALGFYIAGAKGDGNIYCTFACGPWPGAFFAHNGCEHLGLTVKADMGLPIEWHEKTIPRIKAKYLIAYPAFASHFATEMSKKMDLSAFGFKKIILAGEPFGEKFRTKLEDLFKADVTDLYGCGEIGISAMECDDLKASGHLHVLSHELIMEVRKIGTKDQMLPEGEEGEMIVTPLFRTSIPIVRYTMKDIITAYPQKKCKCGLNLHTISRIHGRADDMLTYGGANLYPDSFFQVMDGLGLGDKFQVVKQKDSSGLIDEIVVKIEVESAQNTVQNSQTLRDSIENGMRKKSDELNYVFTRGTVSPFKVELLDHGKIYKGGKFKRFVNKGE